MPDKEPARGLPFLLYAALVAFVILLAVAAWNGLTRPADAAPAAQVATPRPSGPARGDTLVCKTATRGRERGTFCAAIHQGRDRHGNLTVRAAGAVAIRTVRGRRVARTLALRVVLVGDRHGYGRATPLVTTRRAELGPPRVLGRTTRARVLAFVRWGDGEWSQHLLYSGSVVAL